MIHEYQAYDISRFRGKVMFKTVSKVSQEFAVGLWKNLIIIIGSYIPTNVRVSLERAV